MSNPSQARVYHTQQVHYVKATLNFNSGVVTIGTLPAGATILRAISGAQVNVAFNAASTNVIDIGTTANDDLFATDLAGGTIAFVPFDEAVTQVLAADTTFTATYAQTGTAATAGSATIVICYIP
jgi:hypothetical protein